MFWVRAWKRVEDGELWCRVEVDGCGKIEIECEGNIVISIIG